MSCFFLPFPELFNSSWMATWLTSEDAQSWNWDYESELASSTAFSFALAGRKLAQKKHRLWAGHLLLQYFILTTCLRSGFWWDGKEVWDERKEIKNPKSIPAGLRIPVETGRNDRNTPKFYPRWNRGCLVPVCIPVRDFPSVPAGTERNIQLWFNYDPRLHNVFIVDKQGYDTCTDSEGARQFQTESDNITLIKGGNYFICTFPGHYAANVKLAVNAL